MKKFIKISALALSLTFIGIPSSLDPAYASSPYKLERLDLGLNTGNVDYQEDIVSLNQTKEVKEATLAYIRKVRAMMWDADIPYTYGRENPNNTTLRELAKNEGYLDKEAYVNGISWSNIVERAAIQRSYEQSYDISINRPDGTRAPSLTDEVRILCSAESAGGIRYNTATEYFDNLNLTSKDAPRSDYNLLVKSNGVELLGNTKLFDILDPRIKHTGFAIVTVKGKGRYYAHDFSGVNPNSTENMTGYVGDYILYIGDPATRKEPKGLPDDVRKGLETAISKAQAQIDIAENLMTNYPNTVKNVRGKLERMIAESKDLIEEAKLTLEF